MSAVRKAIPRNEFFTTLYLFIVDLNKLRSNSNCNVSLTLGKTTEDLAIIDAGIEQLEAQGDIGAIVRALPASPWSQTRHFSPAGPL
jgi:hypothetical protein